MSTAALDSLFNPRSIALVGASRKPGKMGNLFMQRLISGFKGRIFAINPNEREIEGVPTLASVADLTEPVDLLIALIPGLRMVELMEACPQGAVNHLLAIPSGFGEVSDEGCTLELRLLAAARQKGVRVVGPNCVGLLNCGIGLNASMMPVIPRGGEGVSCITESGGFGMALCMYALDHGLPVSKFCDLGNMIDVQVEDVLRYLRDDPETRLVTLYLEAVRNYQAFGAALEELCERKPVIMCPVGITPAGRRASVAHIGIDCSTTRLLGALPTGVMRAGSGIDLLNRAKALLRLPPARGRRTAIITGTGGIGAELADLATAEGLDVGELSASLQHKLRRHLPYYAGVRNPVDLTPVWVDYGKIYPAVLNELAASGEVDVIVISVTDVATTLPELREGLIGYGQKSGVPLVIYWGCREQDRVHMRGLEAAMFPCYTSPQETVRAAAALSHAGPAAKRS